MRNKFVFHFSRAIDEPIYRILSILCVFTLTIWFIVTLLHGHHYQAFDANLGLLLPPVVCLLFLFGFSERLEVDESGNIFYYAKRFHVLRELISVKDVVLKRDKKYARIDVVTEKGIKPTSMIYRYEDAVNVLNKCKPDDSSRIVSKTEKAA